MRRRGVVKCRRERIERFIRRDMKRRLRDLASRLRALSLARETSTRTFAADASANRRKAPSAPRERRTNGRNTTPPRAAPTLARDADAEDGLTRRGRRDFYRERAIVRGDEHGIDARGLFEREATREALRASARLARRLREDVYVVGGAVRDWASGREARDIDLATRASWEEISRADRSARRVGRRFPVALLRAGRGTVELASFGRGRANVGKVEVSDVEDDEHVDGESPMTPSGEVDYDEILRRRRRVRTTRATVRTPRVRMDEEMERLVECEDNAYERDFTVNAMFYDPRRNEILDFVGGMNDVLARVVRTVKPTYESLREDPVRMLRAIRLAARHGYTMTKELRAGLRAYGPILAQENPRRVFVEVETLMHHGHSEQTFKLLWHSLLMQYMFPVQNDFLVPRMPKKSSLTYEMDVSMQRDFDGGANAFFGALRAYDAFVSSKDEDEDEQRLQVQASAPQWLALIAAPVALQKLAAKTEESPTLPPRWRDVAKASEDVREDARARWEAFTDAIVDVFEEMIERTGSDSNDEERKHVSLLERPHCASAIGLLLAQGPVFDDFDGSTRWMDASFGSLSDGGARLLSFIRTKKRGMDDKRRSRAEAEVVRLSLEAVYGKSN